MVLETACALIFGGDPAFRCRPASAKRPIMAPTIGIMAVIQDVAARRFPPQNQTGHFSNSPRAQRDMFLPRLSKRAS